MSHYFTNENLKSNIKKVLVKVSDNTFTFNTDNGVFSKKGMDFGTRTLIEVLLKEKPKPTTFEKAAKWLSEKIPLD